MKKFHITITNNKTGEVIHDLDTNAIVGGILDDDGVFVVGLTHCPPAETLETIRGAKTSIDQILENNPELYFLGIMLSKENKGDEPEEATDETTEN